MVFLWNRASALRDTVGANATSARVFAVCCKRALDAHIFTVWLVTPMSTSRNSSCLYGDLSILKQRLHCSYIIQKTMCR